MVPIQPKAYERLGDTGDESREGVQRRFTEGQSYAYFHETVMEYFFSMLHKEQLARLDVE